MNTEKKSNTLTELESAKRNLEDREAYHVIMKAANVLIRKGEPEVIRQLMELGLSEKQAKERQMIGGFKSFEITNNKAQITRLRGRMPMLEKKAEATQNEDINERTVEGIRIVENFPADRYQLFFDVKPSQAVIQQLRKTWRWSPPQGCWQRKITEAAKWELDRFLIFVAEENKKVRAV